MERKKKIKYDLSYFTLDGGKKGKGHKKKTPMRKGKSASTKREFGRPPDNMDPNGNVNRELNINEEDAFSESERRRLEKLEARFPDPPWTVDKFGPENMA